MNSASLSDRFAAKREELTTAHRLADEQNQSYPMQAGVYMNADQQMQLQQGMLPMQQPGMHPAMAANADVLQQATYVMLQEHPVLTDIGAQIGAGPDGYAYRDFGTDRFGQPTFNRYETFDDNTPRGHTWRYAEDDVPRTRGSALEDPTIPGRTWMKRRSASVMLMAHLLELKRLVDPASSSVAQQENLEKTKVMLEQAKASVAGTCARARCRVRGGNNAMCGCMGMCVLGYMRARARALLPAWLLCGQFTNAA